ncbi:electron transporter [Aeromicrobium sp. Root495]|uniref:RNA polymerase-binding protein RbpA n=1 Tax=Aeromicrobium sp. Root495 TaxID=1736550 RepID=UPI0006F6A10B|nr:RNA polymerase-binding protein RbpA [Aeromicrobium sp. Root495]KQY59388.1 electron transporter [Aeromicrobium sp. Root495]RYI98608.1 MAG: RNA polymerase-binding protein RbpA [Actinomycetales bacterium]
MAAGAIRGSRIGSGPMGEAERGEAAPRQAITYFCVNDHETVLQFSLEADVPASWDCPRCGMPASTDSADRPAAPKTEPYKTHLAYVKERRTEDEAVEILSEAIETLRAKRKSGEVIF